VDRHPGRFQITTWMQLLALSGHQARRWKPTRLRLRLLSIAGHLVTTARRRTLHLSAHAPWTPAGSPRPHHPARLTNRPALSG
jgi:hypothetical protein